MPLTNWMIIFREASDPLKLPSLLSGNSEAVLSSVFGELQARSDGRS